MEHIAHIDVKLVATPAISQWALVSVKFSIHVRLGSVMMYAKPGGCRPSWKYLFTGYHAGHPVSLAPSPTTLAEQKQCGGTRANSCSEKLAQAYTLSTVSFVL